MTPAGPHFIHNIDPVLFSLGPLATYYYGLAYTLGFLGLHLWLRLRRRGMGWSLAEVYDFSIIFSASVLIFGRSFEIIFYEWGYYRTHLHLLPCYWKGGMASHGLLLGAVAGIWVFCRLRKRHFLETSDEVVIPGAFFLGLGRLGNFINGQIYGYVTDVWWAVKFPGSEGFRHPVALYESLKNFLIIPILLFVRRRGRRGDGRLTAHFILWYGFLRLITDHYREYGNTFLGVGTGQYFNLFMTVMGLGLLVFFKKLPPAEERPATPATPVGAARRMVFAGLLIFCLIIPSSWTKGVLAEDREKQKTEMENLPG